jgi:hypothetical protein
MNFENLIQSCAYVICIFGNKSNLREFELFAYEQACRTLENLLKLYNEASEGQSEPESY